MSVLHRRRRFLRGTGRFAATYTEALNSLHADGARATLEAWRNR